MIEMSNHVCRLLLHKPEMSGIKKRKLIPISNGDFRKTANCENMLLWIVVAATNRIMLIDNKAREINRLISMMMMAAKMTRMRHSL